MTEIPSILYYIVGGYLAFCLLCLGAFALMVRYDSAYWPDEDESK